MWLSTNPLAVGTYDLMIDTADIDFDLKDDLNYAIGKARVHDFTAKLHFAPNGTNYIVTFAEVAGSLSDLYDYHYGSSNEPGPAQGAVNAAAALQAGYDGSSNRKGGHVFKVEIAYAGNVIVGQNITIS